MTQVPSDGKNACLSSEDNESLKNSVVDLEKSFCSMENGASSRVAIFRDREMDRSDPDYDQSFERYI